MWGRACVHVRGQGTFAGHTHALHFGGSDMCMRIPTHALGAGDLGGTENG